MSEQFPEPRQHAESSRTDRTPAPRPRWVTAVIVSGFLLLAVVIALHLTGNSLVGPGSHLP
jgi:hypothetical protein